MALTKVNPAMVGQTSTGAANLTATGSASASLITAAGTGLAVDSTGCTTLPLQPSYIGAVTTSQNIDSSTKVQVNTTLANKNSAIAISASNTRFTVPVAGYYLISASYFMTTSNGRSNLDCATTIAVNGTLLFRFGNNLSGMSGSPSNNGGAGTIIYPLNAGDYIEWFGSGSATILGASGPYHSQLTIALVS